MEFVKNKVYFIPLDEWKDVMISFGSEGGVVSVDNQREDKAALISLSDTQYDTATTYIANKDGKKDIEQSVIIDVSRFDNKESLDIQRLQGLTGFVVVIADSVKNLVSITGRAKGVQLDDVVTSMCPEGYEVQLNISNEKNPEPKEECELLVGNLGKNQDDMTYDSFVEILDRI